MIGEAGRIGLALQLAQFEGDCEENKFLMGETEAKEEEGDWADVFEKIVGVRLDRASMLDESEKQPMGLIAVKQSVSFALRLWFLSHLSYSQKPRC
jgi:hypothetical protein